jgi:hypothetical protein
MTPRQAIAFVDKHGIAFPGWVPPGIANLAGALSGDEALGLLSSAAGDAVG